MCACVHDALLRHTGVTLRMLAPVTEVTMHIRAWAVPGQLLSCYLWSGRSGQGSGQHLGIFAPSLFITIRRCESKRM